MAQILIVDDSESMRSILRSTLQEAGYKVLEAEDGLAGLEIIKNTLDIGLIFCDVNMPRMDGLTMCRKVQELYSYRKIPIFMLTTEALPAMQAEGKKAGVAVWITKPFNTSRLIGAVGKVLPKK